MVNSIAVSICAQIVCLIAIFYYALDSWKMHYMNEVLSHTGEAVDRVYFSGQRGECHGDDLSVKFQFYGTERRCVEISEDHYHRTAIVVSIKRDEDCEHH